MSTIPTKRIDGDASIGRNVAVGGDASVKGEATIEHNLIVKGWLDAKNIKTPNKGVFETEDGLKATYPAPLPGWWAIVLPLTTPQTSTGTANATADTLQGELYIAKAGHEKVEWAKTGLTVSVMGRLDVEAFQERTKAMSERIDLIVGPDDDSAITTLSEIVSFLTGFTTDETLQERVYEILGDLNRVETKHDGEIAGLKTRMGAVETKAESTASGMANLQVGLASEQTAREAADQALSNEIYGLRSDAYIHTVLNLEKLDNWQGKELADALRFLWEHTQKTTMYVSSGTVIVFHSPTEGWVSYQLQPHTAGETLEHIITTPANWGRFAPSTSDIAKLAALDSKATTDAAIKAVADRTTSLEGADAAQDEKIAGICTDLATAQDDITTLESRVESQRLTLVTHTSEISELRSTKADKAKVEQMASDLADAQIAASANAQTLSAHATAIANNHAAIEELKADPHRHVVISLTKLNNWQDKELADALGFLWDYTQQHTLYINLGTVIVFHSPTEGWVSYQWRNRRGTDDEADIKNPANWERYTPKAEDLAKLEALPAKAEIDAAIEAASRQWLIDQAVAAGATYNTSTGKFSYGPTGYVISDIGDDEMLRMLQCRVVGDGFTGSVTPCFGTMGIRINFRPCNEVKDIWPAYQQVCHTNNDIEVLFVEPYGNRAWRLTESNGLQNCAKLRYVSGVLLVDSCNINLTRLPELEHLLFHLRSSYNVNIKDSPKLNLASLQELASYSQRLSSTATVTVHPTVYAKLTDTTNTQWHKVLTDALAKNITFATTE